MSNVDSAQQFVQVQLPDGSELSVPAGTTALEVAQKIGNRLAKAALAARIDGELRDLLTPLTTDCKLEIVTWDDPEGREVYRHTSTHIMAQAVKRLIPEAKITIGPALEDSFYYDFDLPEPVTPELLVRIEEEMHSIIGEGYEIRRRELSRDDAIALFEQRGEPYKVEIIRELPEGETISCYEQGEFIDLCRGPHLPTTGHVKAVKLLSVAGAYWRGDARNKMLQRIYGTSFPDKKLLEEHLRWKKRRSEITEKSGRNWTCSRSRKKVQDFHFSIPMGSLSIMRSSTFSAKSLRGETTSRL